MTTRSWIALFALAAATIAVGMVLFVHVTRAQNVDCMAIPLPALERALLDDGLVPFATGKIPPSPQTTSEQSFGLYVHPETREFLAFGILADGTTTCPLARGSDFRMAPPKPPKPTGNPL